MDGQAAVVAADIGNQAWQESSAPSTTSPSDTNHGIPPKRRQYQSCDYCRQRRRACNAVRLGINPFTQGIEPGKTMSCTTCSRANKRCTFRWLQDSSKRLPPGVKSQLVGPRHRAPMAHGLLKPRKRRPHDAAHPSNDQFDTTSEIYSTASPTPMESESSYSQAPSSVYRLLQSEPPRHPTGHSSIRRESSTSDMSDGDDMANSEEEDLQSVFSMTSNSMTSTSMTSASLSSSIYDRPLTIHSLKPMIDKQMAWTANHLSYTSSDNEGVDQTVFTSISSDDASNEELEEIRRRHRLKGKRREQGKLRDTAVNDGQMVLNTASSRSEGFTVPEIKLAEGSIRSFLLDGLKKIYENSMETSLSCWLTVQNSPYEKRITSMGRLNSTRPPTNSITDTLFGRAHYLDKELSVLRPEPLTTTENALASEVLNLAVLAFASQWSSSPSPPQQDEPSSTGLGDLFNPESFLDSGQLEYLIRQSLWTQLHKRLKRLQDCDSFRVITAKLILFFVTRPLNKEEKDLMEELISGESNPSDSQSASSTKHDSRDSVVHQETASGFSGATRAKKPQSLFELLGGGDDVDHLSAVMQHLSTWSRRIKVFLRNSAPINRISYLPFLKQVKQARTQVLGACSQFNLLFWFAVMLDTARSTFHRRALTFVDEETESQIIKHSSEDTFFIEDAPSKRNLSVSAMSVIDEPGDSEIWGPLQQRPTSDCDDPFLEPRTNFIARMGDVLQESTPMTVLVIRKISHLQSAITARAAEDKIENCIAEILNVYGNWDIRFRNFLDKCVAEHHSLPFKIRSWYITVFGHWFVGYLRGTELIDEYDTQSGSNSIQRALRLSTSLILQLQKESSYKISTLARVSSLDGPMNAVDRSNLEYHSTIRPGSVLTDPGPDIMIFGLKSASDIMLAWLRILQMPSGSLSVRERWVHRNTNADELFGYIRNCVDAMTQLSRLSPFAEINAKIYRKRLKTLEEAQKDVMASHHY